MFALLTHRGRPPSSVDVQRRFWQVIRSQGLSAEDAAEAIGAGANTGRRWFNDAGGVTPSIVTSPSGFRLSLTEREDIAVWWAQGVDRAEIARRLGRHPSTIGRELNARGGRRGTYRASAAQADADRRARRPKPGKLAGNALLRAEVERRLHQRHSPEQIAARLREEFPDDPEMRVSHETIYQALYVQARGGLNRELTVLLRTGRALRKPRRRVDTRRTRLPGKVLISERPAESTTAPSPVTGKAT